MDSNWCSVSPIISTVILLLCLTSSICSLQAVNFTNITHNFRVGNESRRSSYIETLLRKINKPSVRTIQMDGYQIDCVPFHLQPAFDHPQLKEHVPLKVPHEMPEGDNTSNGTTIFEDWSMSGISCPENTIPIKKTTEQDVRRAKLFRKLRQKTVRKYDDGATHEHAIGYAQGEFLGAKAILSIWHPAVEHHKEFSVSQMWIMAGTFENGDLNTIEVGWQVEYGDQYPKIFIHWTTDAYDTTGCYNLQCAGFVQTTRKTIIGASIRPVSSYNGKQFDMSFSVRRDPKTWNWWLQINNEYVGYWPSSLFTRLNKQADMVQIGGEIVNVGGMGGHTKTEMGSGHFPSEGYGKAAYIRNIELVNKKNELYSPNDFQVLSENPDCYYAITVKKGPVWGRYLFYGGPGGTIAKCANK